jgi:carbonic anhydrase
MRKNLVLLITAITSFAVPCALFASADAPAVSAAAARQKLVDGNKRYVEGKMTHPDQTADRRGEVARGQHPFAAIVGCADSRVPPEVIFDQGLGDLFVIRVAGNIADDAALGSLEYAVEHLGVGYIMVLGHERCGAVDATLKGGEAPGHVGTLVRAIQPAVESVKGKDGDPLDHAVRANVSAVVNKLKAAGPILSERVKYGTLTVVGARYDLDDGAVSILP